MKKMFSVLLSALLVLTCFPSAISLADTPNIVFTVNELSAFVQNASDGDVVYLGDTFESGAVTLPMPDVSVVIDGNNKTWTDGGISVTGSGAGSLTIQNLQVDGSSIAERALVNTASAGTLKLLNMTFSGSSFGAISIETSGLLNAFTVIESTRIHHNTAHNTAPAIWLGPSANLELNYSTIENNRSTGGGYECGAVSSKNYAAVLEINNSAFKNNVNGCVNTGILGGGGGAMTFHYFYGKMSINDSYFYQNSTSGYEIGTANTYDGGAIYILDGRDNATLTIDNTTFDSNLAYDDGGALMIQGTANPGLTTTITNCTFYNNKAYGADLTNYSGGAIQFFKNGGSAKMINNLRSCTFVGNQAGSENSTIEQRGGAIALSGAGLFATASVTRTNCLFIGNTVYNQNGQLYTASNYKDISNISTVQSEDNIINADKGEASAHTVADILGQNNIMLSENISPIKAGVNREPVKTIAFKPEGLPDNGYTKPSSSITIPAADQRGYDRYMDIGAVEMTWVKYDANGGAFTLPAQSAYDGTVYYEGENPQKYYKIGYIGMETTVMNASEPSPSHPDGCMFMGWSINSDATQPDLAYAPGTALLLGTENLTLYAVWGYRVTYTDGEDDEVIFEDQGYTVPENTKTPAFSGTSVRTGYSFTGWLPELAATVTKDVTYTAQWEINRYTIQFESNGGSEVPSQTVNYQQTLTKPDDPQKTDYDFTGWYTDSDCTVKWIFEKDTVNSNMTLYAGWAINRGTGGETGGETSGETGGETGGGTGGETGGETGGNSGDGEVEINEQELPKGSGKLDDVPKTGQTGILWTFHLSLMFASLMALTILLPRRKKSI